MKQSQVDYINFRYLLKGNYRKGVHALRSILADNAQAKMFAENPAAVAVVLSYDKGNPDRNAEELYELLTSSSVADLASATYICSTYGVTSFEELYADEEALAQLLADSSSMNAVAASTAAMEALVADDAAFAQACESETAMTAIAASSGAMEIVASDADAMASLAASATGMGVVAASETAMAEVAASTVAMNAVVASSTALSAVISSGTAMEAVLGSTTAVGVAATSAAFCAAAIEIGYAEEILANDTAQATCLSSASCMKAIAADSTALDIWWSLDDSWSNIVAVSPFVAADPSSFAGFVGKKKAVYINGNGDDIQIGDTNVIVVAVGHNTKASGGAAGFTFQFENVLASRKMNSSNTTTGGWASTAMRATYLADEILPMLPTELSSIIEPVAVSYNTAANSSLSTCTDSLWLASEKEVFGSSDYDSAGTQFAWYKNGGSKVKTYTTGSSASHWWLRSVYSSTSFRYVNSGGSAGDHSAGNSLGAAPCFCI